jgi:hypothetical protein
MSDRFRHGDENGEQQHDIARSIRPNTALPSTASVAELGDRHVWPALASHGLDHLTQHLALTADDIDDLRVIAVPHSDHVPEQRT